jgi:PAS domain S-box-containing protein
MGAVATRFQGPRLDVGQLCQLLPDIVVVVSADSTILALNGAFEEVTGHTVADWVGKRFHPLIHPDDRAHVEKAFRDVFDRPTPATIETRVIRPDGSSIFLQALIRKGYDANYGSIAFAVVRDISEPKRLEALLEENERRYRLLFEKNPCPMWVFDRKSWRFLMVNEAAVHQYGYSEEEFLAMTIADIRPSEDVATLRTARREGIRAPADHEVGDAGEWRHRKKDGTVFDVDITWTPLHWNETDASLVMASDISLRKAAERKATAASEELRRSNEELERFASIVSHDLQEPLRMISMYVELLSKRYGEKLGPDATEYVGFALSGAARLKRLILALLEYARVGGSARRLEEVETHRIVDTVREGLRLMIEDAHAQIDVGHLPKIRADATQLSQVLQNLISNAIKFRGTRPPHITISSVLRDSYWQFSVADNGIGMESDQLEKVFLPYERLHHFSQYPGSGLGLALTRKIIERHGGRIWAESKVGEGTTFHFTLPAQASSEGGKSSHGSL